LAPNRSTKTGGTSGSPPGVNTGDILRVLKTFVYVFVLICFCVFF